MTTFFLVSTPRSGSCPDVSDERTATISMVAELLQVDAEVIRRKKYMLVIKGCFTVFGQ
jgi:hypothetical protein